MATYSGPVEEDRVTLPDPQMQGLVNEIEQPEHQGVPLQAKDYVALIVVTALVPMLITVWGGLVS